MGYEKIWFIADDFGTESFINYFYNSAETLYTNETFEVTGFLTKSYGNADRSPLSRLMNSLTYAMQEKLCLPKIIMFIFEDDIIRHRVLRTDDQEGITEMYTRVLKWLTSNVSRAIEAFKEYLPERCKRTNIPRVVFMAPAINVSFTNNGLRKKFARSLNVATKLHENMSCLELRQGWDQEDQGVFLNEGNIKRWTSDGYKKYWMAIDKCVSFCNSSMEKRARPKLAQTNFNRPYNRRFPPQREEEIESYSTRPDLRWQLNRPHSSFKNYYH